MSNSDYRNHPALARKLQAYLRWRNAQGSLPRHAGRPAPRARPHPQRTPATLGPPQTQGCLTNPVNVRGQRTSIEVEQAICAHPAVLECAVIGIPHPHWGERPKAFVTLNEGDVATRTRSSRSAASALAHYKCPDAIEFGPLPKTSNGKMQKFVLRDREWTGQDKRISGA